VIRKSKQKERDHRKEEPKTAADSVQPDMEQEISDVIEDTPAAEEENFYISDEEEEKCGFLFSVAFMSLIAFRKLCCAVCDC